MVRKATSMKEINERREAAEKLARLERANREQAEEIKDLTADNAYLNELIEKMLHDKQEPPPEKLMGDVTELRTMIANIYKALCERIYKLEHPEAPRPNGSALKDLEQRFDATNTALMNANERISLLEKLVHEVRMSLSGMAARVNGLEDQFKPSDPLKYEKEAYNKQPDPFLAHEALDRTNMVMEILYSHVEQHPFVQECPPALRKIVQAGELLASAYQDIGNAS